jgi:predicted Ser/Thr protein kinase
LKVQELKGVTIENKIGAGNFGEVYLGKWEGSAVALKKLTQDQISEFEREAAILWSKKFFFHLLNFSVSCNILL